MTPVQQEVVRRLMQMPSKYLNVGQVGVLTGILLKEDGSKPLQYETLEVLKEIVEIAKEHWHELNLPTELIEKFEEELN